VRLFLAVKPDRPAEAQLAQRLLHVQEALGSAAARLRWTPAANMHATLHFLGEIAPSHWPRLRDALGATVTVAPFDIALGGVGVFPESGPPRVVWLDVVRGVDELQRVHADLGRTLAGAGFAIESRPFSPHLTLARVPDRERAHTKSVREQLRSVPMTAIGWRSDHVALFRSDLSGPVPRYEVIHEVALANDH
jgi:2'-5' RNA ligase